ncbi:MAG TPA: J domain-containing protein [Polyangia bacterium]
MSIGKRLIDMARSELNSLLDVAAKHGPDDDEPADRPDPDVAAATPRGGSRWQDEIEWARRARQEVEDAIHGRRTPEPPPRARTGGTAGRPRSAAGGEALRVQKAYAALEVPVGSDFEAVRRSYRALMRKYHPDHHTQSPEKQKAANDVAQGLTDAYKVLEKKLRK